MTSTINSFDVTATWVSETPELGVGCGTSQKSLSASQNPAMGVLRSAPFSDNAEKVVPQNTPQNTGSVRENGKDLNARPDTKLQK